jgi:hypothetical protein
MLQPTTGTGFFRMHLRHLDLCSNKIGNEGLKLLKKYVAGVMMGKSQLKHLSLYDNDLEGMSAIEEIRELLTMLR